MEQNVEEGSEEAILYDPNRELGRKVKEEVVESEPKFNKEEEGVEKVKDESDAASEAELNEAASGLTLAVL